MIKLWNKGTSLRSFNAIEIRFTMFYVFWFSKDKLKNKQSSIRIVR